MKNDLKSDLSSHRKFYLCLLTSFLRKLLKFYFQSFLLGVPVRLGVLLKRLLKVRFGRKSSSASVHHTANSQPCNHSRRWSYREWYVASRTLGTPKSASTGPKNF